MKLFKLTREDAGWDDFHGFVIRAADEPTARKAASDKCEDDFGREQFLDPLQSTCVEVPVDGDQEIILADFWPG